MNPSDLRTQRASVVGVCQNKLFEIIKHFDFDDALPYIVVEPDEKGELCFKLVVAEVRS